MKNVYIHCRGLPGKKTLLYIVFLSVFYGLILFVHKSPSFIRPNDDPKELILYIAAFLAGLSHFLSELMSKKRDGPSTINILSGIVGAYIFYHAVNLSLVTGHHYEGFIVLGKLVVLIVFVKALADLEAQTFALFFKVCLILGAIAVLCSFFYTASYNVIFPFGHVSYYSDCVLLLLPGAVYFYFSEWRRSSQIIFAAIIVLCTSAIWMAGTRATVVGIAIALFVSGIFIAMEWRGGFSRTKKIELLVITLACLAGIGFIQQFPQLLYRGETPAARLLSLAQSVDEQTLENASSGRITIYRNTLEGWRERPSSGWGIGSFKFVYPKFIKTSDGDQSVLGPSSPSWLMHSHCELLNQFFEGGLIGGILFSFSLGVLLIYLVGIIRNRDDPGRYRALMVFLSIIAAFSSFQFSTAFDHPLVRAFLLPYFALGYSLARNKLRKVKIPVLKRNIARLFLLIIFCLSGAIAIGNSISSFYLKRGQAELSRYKKTELHHVAQFVSPWAFNTLYRSADYEIKMKNFRLAEKFLITGIKQFPYVPLFHYKLGLLYYNQGRFSEAIHLLEPINRLYPRYEPIRNLLTRLNKSKVSSR